MHIKCLKETKILFSFHLQIENIRVNISRSRSHMYGFADIPQSLRMLPFIVLLTMTDPMASCAPAPSSRRSPWLQSLQWSQISVKASVLLHISNVSVRNIEGHPTAWASLGCGPMCCKAALAWPNHGQRRAPLKDHLTLFSNNFIKIYNILNIIILKL